MLVTRDDLGSFAGRTLFIDVSCDEGMGFEFDEDREGDSDNDVDIDEI